jgi:hypothetical protein
MSMRESLAQAMHLPVDGDTIRWMNESGVALANEETMSRAIHDIYCGITADHEHPNEKDHQQAQMMIAALQKHATSDASA